MPNSSLLPLWEKVAAKRSDEGSFAPFSKSTPSDPDQTVMSSVHNH